MMSEKANKRFRIGADGVLPSTTDDSLVHNTLSLTAGQVDNRYDHTNIGTAFSLLVRSLVRIPPGIRIQPHDYSTLLNRAFHCHLSIISI